jgi:pyruvate formate lyase activating enzyme
MKGRIFNIERYSLHNGPGIRTTVFLKGCPLNCAWCGNPESQRSSNDLMYNPDLCLSECNECVHVCPVMALHKNPLHKITLNRAICNRCGDCVAACPTRALSQIGMSMSVEEVVSELCKDRPFYNTSGGGMTISGGEPLHQPEFTREVLKSCKTEDLHTTVDTCGDAAWDVLDEILDYTDMVLYDLKFVDPKKHQQYTGVGNDRILDNLINIARSQAASVIIRLPIIPGINDSDQDLNLLLDFLERTGYKHIHILPYHRLGQHKYSMLGRSYQLDAVQMPTKERLESLKVTMTARGFFSEIID